MKTMQTRARVIVAALFVVICTGLAPKAEAQRIDQFIISTFTGFTDIVGQGGTVQLYTGGAYYFTYALSMPFAFKYDNTVYNAGTTLYVYNGSASFNSYSLYYYPVINPANFGYSASQAPNTMAPYSGLQISGGVYYQTSGTAPNRVLTVEWYQDGNYSNRSLGTCSFQLKMYETINQIEFTYEKYGFSMLYSSTYAQQTGLNGNTSPSFIQVVINGSTSNTNTPTSNYRFSLTPPVELSTSPKLINFPALSIGQNTTANVTVKNAATDPLSGNLVVSSATISGDPDFTVISMPGALAPGISGTMTVQFQPIAEGTRAAVLTIKSNGRDSGTQTIQLTGTSLAPMIAIDTNVLFKKTFTKMGQSLTRNVAIHSIGSATLLWTGFSITGADAGQYAVTRQPSQNPIPIGAWDTVGITYTPTIEGRHTAVLNIQSNALNYPSLPVQLIGTGTLPHIVITPTSIRFDSTYEGDTARQTFTIWNPGSDTLRISPNMLTSNDADFSITNLTGADTAIAPDRTKTLTVTFVPKQMGSRQARYMLRTNIIPTFEFPRRDTAGLVVVNISGSGVPFGVLAQSISGATYDTTIKGTQVCRVDTIRNDGDADIMLSGWTLSGANAADFTASGITFPYLLKARSMAIVNLCGTPSDFGLRSANLAINGTSNKKNVSVSLSLNVYGLKVCASALPTGLFTNELIVENTDSMECVTVTNCGEVAAVYTATLSNNADYSVSPSQSATIPANGTASFCVKFHPTTYGASNASLKISTPDVADITVPITGIGACANVTAPQPSIQPTGAGGHQPFTVTFTNSGNYTWTADGANKPTITPNDGVFLLGDVMPVPGNNGQVVVNGTFNPTEINKMYTAQVTFPNAVPACASPVVVTLSVQSGPLSTPASIEKDGFSLGQNYPNPFAAATTFVYTTPTEAPVMITISDVTGHLVRTITNGRVSAGEHVVSIDANEFANGTYIVRLTSGSVSLARQIVVVK